MKDDSLEREVLINKINKLYAEIERLTKELRKLVLNIR